MSEVVLEIILLIIAIICSDLIISLVFTGIICDVLCISWGFFLGWNWTSIFDRLYAWMKKKY